MHERHRYQAQVVERSHAAVERHDHQQRALMTFGAGHKEVKLSPEPKKGRDAGQAECANSQRRRNHRGANAQTRKVINGIHFMPIAFNGSQRTEGCQIGHAVGQEIEKRGINADGWSSQNANQHVAGIGDRAVRQHALGRALQERTDVAKRHGEDRNHPEHRGDDRRNAAVPVGAPANRAKQDDEGHKPLHFRHETDERSHRAGGAFIDIGRVEVHRDGGQLEADANHGKQHANDRHAANTASLRLHLE